MAMLYPQRQTLLILCVCFAVVAAVAYYTFSIRSKAPAAQGSDISAQAPQAPSDIELKGTALENWRDQFIGSTTRIASNIAPAEPTGPLTLTDQFGREFFEKYMLLQQGNLTNDSEAITRAMNNTLANAVNSSGRPQSYSLSEVRIAPSSDAAAIFSYGNTTALIFNAYGPRIDVPTIAINALERDDEGLMAEIDPTLSNYDALISGLLAVPVPQPLARNHIDLINAVSGMRFAAYTMRNVFTDPMQALVSIASYADTQNALRDSLLALRKNFEVNGVIFTASDPAFIFSKII